MLPAAVKSEFGRNLLLAREQLSWDRQHLIEQIRKHLPNGVHENTIYNIEKGRVKGKRETVRVIKEIISAALHRDYPWGNGSNPVTKENLGNYIQKSELVNRLDTGLIEGTGLSIVPADSFLDLYLARTAYVGIKTIDELEARLTEYADLIIIFGGHLCRDKSYHVSFLARGASIGFLQLLLVLTSKPADELETFLSRHSLNKAQRHETRARAIRRAFDKASKFLNK